MEKVIINPSDVRALGNIVSPKVLADYKEYWSNISSSSETVDNYNLPVFVLSYAGGSSLTLTSAKWVTPVSGSFTVTVVLKDYTDSPLTSKTVSCTVNDGETSLSATTGSDGVASFTVSTVEGVCEYYLRFSYAGNSSYSSGCFLSAKIVTGDSSSVAFGSLWADKPIIQTGDTSNIITSLTGVDCNGDSVPVVGQLVKFYESWTPVLRVGANPSIIQTGDTTDLSAQLYDSDGSLIRESGHNITFGVEQDTITMFNGTETFTRVGTGTGTLNISYSQDNELVYTASSGIVFHSDLIFQSDTNWECTFKLKATGSDGGRVGLYAVSSESGERKCVGLKPQNINIKIGIGTSDSFSEENSSVGFSNYVTVKIITVNQSAVRVYINDNLKHSMAVDWLNEPLCFGLHGWTTGNVIYVKDFSFKESE